jgi:uncharacterized protein (DUF736 family)
VSFLFHDLDDAGDVWDAFQDKGVPLFQVQLDHPAQRAVTFQMRDAMNDFLRSLHKEDEAMPGTVQELERQLGVRIVIADRTDPEEVGYVQWRTAVGRFSFSRAIVRVRNETIESLSSVSPPSAGQPSISQVT